MAVVSMCSVFSCKKHAHPTINGFTQIERGIIDCHLPGQKFKGCVSTSLLDECSMRWNTLQHGSELFLKSNRMLRAAGFCVVDCKSMLFQNSVVIPVLKVYNKGTSKMSESSSMEKDSSQRQLKALDCYFGKLRDDMNEQHSSCVPITSNFENSSDREAYQMESSFPLEGKVTESGLNQYETKTGLDSLENYFEKLNPAIHTEKGDITKLVGEVSERDPVRTPTTSAVSEHYEKENVIAEKNDYTYLQSTNDEIGRGLQDLQAYSEASDLYPVNLLVAINIAVFLFEKASPIRNSELEQMSLPLIYGGKINKLILDGEWWRLLTPMFLHSGLLHVTLSCWVLLTFGPQVCRRYGPFTFFLIFVLGGLCGNLTSFLHTTELTVCGTGPAFAMIGAWLVFQIQNKQIVAKEVSERMFWKAVIATGVSFILSNFGRIDDWMHLGATFSGIIYGYLTCPTLHVLDNASSPSKNEIQKQGVALVQQQADPCKSLGIFIISILVIVACFTFFLVPQVEILELDGYI